MQMIGKNMMNYSILQSDLEQEQAQMEDMHMFFVAFSHKQNKILQIIEKPDMVAMANDRYNFMLIDD